MSTPTGPSGGHWQAHISPDGRPYWNHSVTKQSVWEKPSELKTAVELEMEKTPWREYETGGRKYWVHKETKESVWELPIILREILAKAAQAQQSPQPSYGSPIPQQAPAFVQPQGSPLTSQSGALVAPGGFVPSLPSRPSAAVPQMPVAIPDFGSHEEAVLAFMNMLKTLKVTPEWTWEQVMRETITEPMYKALKTLAERKAAYERYVKEIKETEKAQRQQSLDKCRKEFHKALDKLGGGVDREDGFKVWWSVDRAFYECGRRISAEIWERPRNDAERKDLIEEFILILKTKETTRKRDLRMRNMDKISSIFQALRLDLAGPVRWRDAQATVMHTPAWQNDPELQGIEPIDIMHIYEEELKKAEKEAHEVRSRVFEDRRRRGRKAREDFLALLEELRSAGVVTAGSTWKAVYPFLEQEDRYLDLLGVSGSTPLDLFFDIVDDLDTKFDDAYRIVGHALDDRKFDLGEETPFDDFKAAIVDNEQVAKMDEESLKAVYEKLHSRAIRAAKEDRRRAEKKQRLRMDDLRYAYKKLDPPVDLESSYEDNLERIKETPEFLALTDEESRRTAFDKFIKRQKEKLRERAPSEGASSEHRRDRGDRDRGDRERERDHDRDHEAKFEARSSRRERDRNGGEGRRHRSPDGADVQSKRDDHTENGLKREASEDADERKRKLARTEEKPAVEPMQGVKAAGDVEEGEI